MGLISQILGLDKMVAMRDDLAIKLINDENLSILAENDQLCYFILMLPFVLFTIAIQSDNLSIEAHKKLFFYLMISFIKFQENRIKQKK